MLRYKTTKGVVTKIIGCLEEGIDVCVEMILNDSHKSAELIHLFNGHGFKVVRKVTHIDNVPKKDAISMGYESLDFGTNEIDESGWRLSEPLVQAECLKREHEFIQIYVGNVCGHYCLVSCGGDELLTKDLC